MPAANILVATSHNHSGPGLTRSRAGPGVDREVAAAAKEAAMQHADGSIGYGEDQIGFSINRRKVIDGRAVVPAEPRWPERSAREGAAVRRWQIAHADGDA